MLVERPAAADADLAEAAEGVGVAESHSAVRHELQVAAALHLCKRQSLVSSTDKVNLFVWSIFGWSQNSHHTTVTVLVIQPPSAARGLRY